MSEDDSRYGPSREGDSNDEAVCARCGRVIETSEWYPVTTETDPDGTLHIRSFCSESCRDEWNAGPSSDV